MKRVFRILIPGMFVFAVLAFNSIDENDRYFQIVKNLDIFATLFKEVNANYVDEINPGQLIKVGIDAMLNSLDPYTSYIPEDDTGVHWLPRRQPRSPFSYPLFF